MNNNELMHYGVLGMKWGKRKNYYGQSKVHGSKREAKKAHKKAINDAYEKIKKSQSIGSKITYDDATYRRAAKNMVNKGMDQKKAVSRAKMAAWRNAGISAAGTFVYANRDKIASSIKRYANQKAMQKANAGIARIGTLKLTKVAGNVYEYRMR